MIVRPATWDDFSGCYELGEEVRSESLTEFPPIDVEICRLRLSQTIIMPEAFFWYVAEIDGRLVGFFVGSLQQHFFSRNVLAINETWYVRPENRGSMAAYKLLREFIAWAKRAGSEKVHIHLNTKVNAERNRTFLYRLGFQDNGVVLRKDL